MALCDLLFLHRAATRPIALSVRHSPFAVAGATEDQPIQDLKNAA